MSINLAYSPLCRLAANDHIGLKKFKAVKDERPTSTQRDSSTTTAVNNGQQFETITLDDSDACDVDMELTDQTEANVMDTLTSAMSKTESPTKKNRRTESVAAATSDEK